jgi:hypothetical protein
MNELQATYNIIDNLEKEELTKLITYINNKLLYYNVNSKKSINFLEKLSELSATDSISNPVDWQKEQRVEIGDFN